MLSSLLQCPAQVTVVTFLLFRRQQTFAAVHEQNEQLFTSQQENFCRTPSGLSFVQLVKEDVRVNTADGLQHELGATSGHSFQTEPPPGGPDGSNGLTLKRAAD